MTQQKPTGIRAAIYARVSSQAQRDKHTIENQLRVLPAFVASQGWALVDTYVDDGKSAKSGKLDARDGFARLVRDAEARRFDLVVVVDVDRLTRTDSIEERALILGPFQRLGIDIVTPSGGRLDMRTMLGELWITIQAMGAAEENRKRAERIKAGKARAIAEGRKPAGPTPYGHAYSRATGKWSIDEVRGAIVREIFERVAGGESCLKISDDLDARNAPRPRGPWSREKVWRIATARTAVGEWHADKAKGAVIAVPAIVTEAQWQATQRALIAHGKRGLVKTKHVYLLEGIATCAACGSPIGIRSASPARAGRVNPAAYVCRARKLERACKAKIVQTAVLDERVWAALSAELEQPALITALADVEKQRAGDAHDWASDAEGYRAHLDRLEKVESAIMARFRRGIVSEGALDTELAALGRERKMVRDQLATAERAMGSIATTQERLRAATATIERLRDALPLATQEQRRALIHELVRDGGVVIADGRARLDLRLMRAEDASEPAARRSKVARRGEAATSRGASDGAPAIFPAIVPGYRTDHGTIAGPILRLRVVA